MDTSTHTLFVSGLALIMLVITHWSTPLLRNRAFYQSGGLNSWAAGISFGFVFLYILPGLFKIFHVLSHALEGYIFENEDYLALCIFATMMVGALTMFWLEKTCLEKTDIQSSPRIPFMVHILVMAFINLSIGFTMTVFFDESFLFTLMFITVMGCNILMEETTLTLHFQTLYTSTIRHVLVACLVIGWGLGIPGMVDYSPMMIILPMAFMAGTLIMNIVKTELSIIEGRSRFNSFLWALGLTTSVIGTMNVFNYYTRNIFDFTHGGLGSTPGFFDRNSFDGLENNDPQKSEDPLASLDQPAEDDKNKDDADQKKTEQSTTDADTPKDDQKDPSPDQHKKDDGEASEKNQTTSEKPSDQTKD